MDGNGRWAAGHGRPRSDGHRAGTDNIRNIIRAFDDYGVQYVTLFAFSTENWDRPGDEVQTLISIIQEVIRKEAEDLHQEGVRIRHLGRLDRLSPGLQQAIQDSVELTKDNTRLTLNVAFDYGGRAEITSAVQYAIDHLDTHFEVIPIRGPVLDLTSRDDIASVAERLRGQAVHL